MALIKCPDCGKMISELAPACIGCGRPKVVSVQESEPLPQLSDDSLQRNLESIKYEVRANGVEYGPLSLAEVRDRIGRGDFNVNVWVRREGSTGLWESPAELLASGVSSKGLTQAQVAPYAGKFWVRANGIDYGPYTLIEFKDRHERGEFPVSVWIRSEGSWKWLKPEEILKDGRSLASSTVNTVPSSPGLPEATLQQGKEYRQKVGMGGWLAFLVGLMLAIGPCVSVGKIIGEVHNIERDNPDLSSNSSWAYYKKVFFIIQGMSVSYLAYSGFLLYRKFKYSSVKNAKYALWICGPLTTFIISFIIPYAFFGQTNVESNSLGGLLISIIVIFAWTRYLSKSKRVKATYPR